MGDSVQRDYPDGPGGYLCVMEGRVDIGSDKLSAGNAAKILGSET